MSPLRVLLHMRREGYLFGSFEQERRHPWIRAESSGHNFTWMRAETISSYSNFVLPWFNSAFWRADCFFMYSSKSSRPKSPISPRWTSFISESISREDEVMWSVSLEGEIKKNTKRIFWDKSATENEFSCPVNLVTFKPTQKHSTHWRLKGTDTWWNLRRSSCEVDLGGSAHWTSELCLELICKVNLKAISDSVILVWKLLQWRTFENCLTDSR